jgi:hypothetical protein
MALRPFFMVSSTAFAISFLALHLTQYPSGIRLYRPARFMRPGGTQNLTGRVTGASTVDSSSPQTATPLFRGKR